MKCRFIFLVLLLLPTRAFPQVSADPYSGRAMVNIPLWTLHSGSLSYPITANYVSGGGIKANSYGGQLGVGWQLTGCSIIRDLRGLPDDYSSTGTPAKQGWLTNNVSSTIGGFTPGADDNLNNCSDEISDFNFLNSLGGFSGNVIKDLEPDIYTVTVPGISASFIFDNVGQIAFLTKQDLVAKRVTAADGTIMGFAITDATGVIYTFGDPVQSRISVNTTDENGIIYFKYNYNLYKGGFLNYNSVWKLLSIESPNGDKISFEYDAIEKPMLAGNGYEFPLKTSHTDNKSVYTYNESTGKHEKKAQYSITQSALPDVHFSRAIGRTERIEIGTSTLVLPTGTDAQVKQPIIGDIRIYDIMGTAPTLIRKFDFGYKVVSETEEDGLAKYIFLRSIIESSEIRTMPPYLFDYYGVNFKRNIVFLSNSTGSGTRTRSVDEFGYFNAFVSSVGAFKTYLYPTLTGADRFRTQPIPGYSGFLVELNNSAGANVDLAGLTTATLSQIIVPNGGTSRIIYEPNTYYDPTALANYYGGGLRVKRLEYHDGIDRSKDIAEDYTYEEDNGTSTGVLLHRPFRAFNLNFYKNQSTGVITYYHALVNSGLSASEIWKRTTVFTDSELDLNEDAYPGQWVGYKKVSVSRPGMGKTVYEFSIAAGFGTQEEGDWTASRNRFARGGFASNSPLVSTYDPGPITGYYGYPFVSNPYFDFRRGLLKSVTKFNNANNPVERTENDYIFLSSPQKTYGLRIDQYKALSVVNSSLAGIRDQESPAFIYSRYEIYTRTRARLLKSSHKIYDQNNPSVFSTDETNYEYLSPLHDFVTRVTKNGSDGIEYTTNYKYPLDYTINSSWNQQDNTVKAITRLKDKNIILPIETWSTQKEPLASAVTTGATMSYFEYDGVRDNIYVRKNFTVATHDGVNFTPSNVTNNGGISSFTYDNTNYNQFTEYLHQDDYGTARSTLGYNRSKSSVHYGWNGSLPKLDISNALANEVVFSDFEGQSEYEFTTNSSPSYVDGKTYGKALRFVPGTANKIFKSFSKGDGMYYLFSCWVKAASAGVITVRVNDGVHPQATVSMSFANTNSLWKYYFVKVPTGTFNSSLNIEVETSGSVDLDDALFYPASASMKTYLYGKALMKLSETDSRGISQYYEYDDMGRLTLVRDQDLNIVNAYSYQVKGSEVIADNPVISVSDAYVNKPVTFTAERSLNLPDVIYKWKFVKLSDHITNNNLINDFSNADVVTGINKITKTFTSIDTWLANVQMVYQGVSLTTENYARVDVTKGALDVSICTNRPTEIDLCKTVPIITTCIPTQTNNMILRALITNGSGSYSYQWTRSDAGEVISTSSDCTITDYTINRRYTCRVTDLNTQESRMVTLDVKTYQSDPSCSVPSQN